MKNFLYSLAAGSAFISLALAGAASAQTTIAQPVSACVNVSVTHNLYYGSTDYSSGGDVTRLQTFLYQEGLFNYQPIGIYGPLTFHAVQQFQRAHGISPVGAVGPLTRAAITQVGCNGGVVPPPTSAAPTIYRITPTSGPTGTQVSITGFGFTNDNTIHFGYGVVMHVPITSSIAIACTTDPSCHGGINQTLTFTVPNSLDPACRFSTPQCMVASMLTSPGSYNISVENSSGTSNTMSFTVTSAQTQTVPVINSLAPNFGPVGTTVTVGGSGFTQDSLVNFGNGSLTPSSVSANSITFTVPQYVSPYCPPNAMCALWVQQIMPGSYNVSIKNSAGTSNVASYTVQ